MSQIPSDLKYAKSHEWVRLNADGTAVVGITDYAQNSLGDITFVELPDVGASFAAGESFGVVESVKAASDLYLPVAGEVLEINEALQDAPQNVNQAPYGDGWMLKIKVVNAGDVAALLSEADYRKIVG